MPNQMTSFNLFEKLDRLPSWLEYVKHNDNLLVKNIYTEIKSRCKDKKPSDQNNGGEYHYAYHLGIGRDAYDFGTRANADKVDKNINNIFCVSETGAVEEWQNKIFVFWGLCGCFQASSSEQKILLQQKIINAVKDIIVVLQSLIEGGASRDRVIISMLLNMELVNAVAIHRPSESIPDAISITPVETKESYSRQNTPIVGSCLSDWATFTAETSEIFSSSVTLMQRLAEPDVKTITTLYNSIEEDVEMTLVEGIEMICFNESVEEKPLDVSIEEALQKIHEKEPKYNISFLRNALAHSIFYIIAAGYETRRAIGVQEATPTNIQLVEAFQKFFPLMARTPLLSDKGLIHNAHLLRYVNSMSSPEVFYNTHIADLNPVIVSALLRWIQDSVHYVDEASNRNELAAFFSTDPDFLRKLEQQEIYAQKGVESSNLGSRNATDSSSSDVFVSKISNMSLWSLMSEVNLTENLAVQDELKRVKLYVGPRKERIDDELKELGACARLKGTTIIKQLFTKVFYQLFIYEKNIRKERRAHEKVEDLPQMRENVIQSMIDLMKYLNESIQAKQNNNPVDLLTLLSAEVMMLSTKGKPIYFGREVVLSVNAWITANLELFQAYCTFVEHSKVASHVKWEGLMDVFEGRQKRVEFEEGVSSLNHLMNSQRMTENEFRTLQTKIGPTLYSFTAELRYKSPVEKTSETQRNISSRLPIRFPLASPKEVYERIRKLPYEERQLFIENMFFSPGAQENEREEDINISHFKKQKELLLLLAGEYMFAKKALALHAEGKSLTFEECLNATKLNVPNEISAIMLKLLNEKQLTQKEEKSMYLWGRGGKVSLRKATNRYHLEERILFQRRFFGDGPLRKFMLHERLAWLGILNLKLTSQISIVETEMIQTQKLLAVLFFRDHYSVLNSQVKETFEALIVDYFTRGRTKEAFTQHLFGLTAEEQDRFLAEIVKDPNSVLGKLYRKSRIYSVPDTTRGLLGVLSSQDAKLERFRTTSAQVETSQASESSKNVDNITVKMPSSSSQGSFVSVEFDREVPPLVPSRNWAVADDSQSQIVGNSSSVHGKTKKTNRDAVIDEFKDVVDSRKNSLCMIQ